LRARKVHPGGNPGNAYAAEYLQSTIKPVASLRLVSLVAVSDGVTLFLPQKVMTFLVIVLKTGGLF